MTESNPSLHEYDSFRELEFEAARVASFPWPVAANYADIRRAVKEHRAVTAAWLVRDGWELLIRFLATIAIADCLSGPHDERTSTVLSMLTKRKGMAIGDWVKIFEVAAERDQPATFLDQKFHQLLNDKAGRELRKLMAGGDENTSFVTWRNRRFGHGVFGPSEHKFADEAARFLEKLHRAYGLCADLLQGLRLESEFPTGDQLAWQQESPLQKYHVHAAKECTSLMKVGVRTPEDRLIDLSPLLTVQRCTLCREYAAFYFDEFDLSTRRTCFLDFVKGHRIARSELAVTADWASRVGPSRDADSRAVGMAVGSRLDLERFSDLGEHFVKPKYLAKQVAAVIQNNRRGSIMVLTGEGGVGKSWFAYGLKEQGDLLANRDALGRPIDVFVVHLMDQTTASLGVQSIIASLKKQSEAKQRTNWLTPRSSNTIATFLTEMFKINRLGEMLLVLDGLDELDANSTIPSAIPKLEDLPKGCHLLLTTRPNPRRAVEEWLERHRGVPVIDVRAESKDNRDLILEYIKRQFSRTRNDLPAGRLPEAWESAVVERSRGIFLYAAHFCHSLRWGAFDDVRQLPNPENYYHEFFRRVRYRVGSKIFFSHYSPILTAIAALSTITLPGATPEFDRGFAVPLEALGRGDHILDVLSDFSGLLRVRRESYGLCFEIAHAEIFAYLTKNAFWMRKIERAREQYLNAVYAQLQEDPFQFDVTRPIDCIRVSNWCALALEESQSDPKTPWARNPLLLESVLAFGSRHSLVTTFHSDPGPGLRGDELRQALNAEINWLSAASLVGMELTNQFIGNVRQDVGRYADHPDMKLLRRPGLDSKTCGIYSAGLLLFEPGQVELHLLLAERYWLEACVLWGQQPAERPPVLHFLRRADNVLAKTERIVAQLQAGTHPDVSAPEPTSSKVSWISRLIGWFCGPTAAVESHQRLSTDPHRVMSELLNQILLAARALISEMFPEDAAEEARALSDFFDGRKDGSPALSVHRVAVHCFFQLRLIREMDEWGQRTAAAEQTILLLKWIETMVESGSEAHQNVQEILTATRQPSDAHHSAAAALMGASALIVPWIKKCWVPELLSDALASLDGQATAQELADLATLSRDPTATVGRLQRLTTRLSHIIDATQSVEALVSRARCLHRLGLYDRSDSDWREVDLRAPGRYAERRRGYLRRERRRKRKNK